MKKLVIVGNVDTRCIVYPIARALSLDGLTAVVTDDGAYRRLYHGHESRGTVSGVDIVVGSTADDDLVNLANASGVPYDTAIIVSSNYVPSDADGVIMCHGADRSIMGKTQAEEEAEEEARLEKERLEAQAARENAHETASKKKTNLKKSDNNSEESSEDTEKTEGTEKAEDAVDPEVEAELLKKKQEESDVVRVPDEIRRVEVYISFQTPSTKGGFNILLKESAMSYVYGCEERKEIPVYPDKVYNKMLATILNKALDMDVNDVLKLLERSEYISGGKK